MTIRHRMTSRHRWAGVRALAAIGLLAGGLGGVAAPAARAQDGGQGKVQTAMLAPADSLAFVSLNTDASSDQWTLAADLLDQGGLEDLVYGTVGQLVEESGLPGEWITPGSSLLGDEVSVVVVPGGPDGVDVYLVLSSANPNQAFETIRSRFLSESGDDDYLATYEEDGLTILSSAYDQTSVARVDDLIVFGTSTGVQQAVGVANGAEPSLADQPAFSDVVDELEEDRIATAWANGPALGTQQSLLYGSSGFGAQELALIAPLYGLGTGAYSAVGVWADEAGFRLDVREMAGPRADGLTAPDDATDLDQRAPDDALLFVDGMDLGEIAALRSYVDAIAFGVGGAAAFSDTDGGVDDGESGPYTAPTLEESYAQLEKLLGFDLRADLIDQLAGDYGLTVSSSSLDDASDLTALLVSDVADAKTVDASVDRLITLLRLSAGGEVTVNRIRLGGADVTELLVPDMTAQGPLRVTVGVVDGQLLIGVGSGMEQYLDGPLEEPLAHAERFDAAFDALPDDDGGRFYLDVHRLIELDELAALEPTMGLGDPLDDPQLAALDGIQALAAVTRMDGETRVTSVVLTIDADAVDGATPASTPDASPEADASPVAGMGAPVVADVTALDAGGRRLLGVSPADGALLTFDQDADEVCVEATADEVEVCGGPIRSVDELHVAWSPDGRRVAFTENAVIFLYDSDVHVLDRDAGELQNWTDDGWDGGFALFDDRSADAPSLVPVDLTPTWTPDGEGVVFGRTVVGENLGDATTILYRVDGPHAEPVRVAPVATYPFATYYGVAYAPDGRLIYTSSSSDPGDPTTGLFELSADGTAVRQVLASREETGPPFLLGVTSAGSALVTYRNLAMQAGLGDPDQPCTLALVDLATTRPTELRMPDGSCAQYAGLTSNGGTVLLLSSRGIDDAALATLDVADETAAPVSIALADVLPENQTDGGSLYFGDDDLGLSVTDAGDLLLRDGPSGGVLIRLG